MQRCDGPSTWFDESGDLRLASNGALHPDRSFDTLSCGARGLCDAFARMERGVRCAVLAPWAAQALGRASFAMRTTLAPDETGRVRVAGLRAWLSTGCGAPRLVVNDAAGPYLCRPLQMGADLVVEDLRVWAGGALLDEAFPDAPPARPCRIVAARTEQAWRDLASCLEAAAPGAGALWELPLDARAEGLLAGVFATLSSQAQRRSDTALAAAHFLAAHPQVAWVSYPGLAGDAQNDVARKTLDHGFGPCVGFGLRDAGGRFASESGVLGREGTTAAPAPCALRPSGYPRSRLEASAASQDAFVMWAGLESALDVVAGLERFLDSRG